MDNNRVYIENVQWNVSRTDLVEMLSTYAGWPYTHLQIIRKGPSDETYPGRKCSAIVTFATAQQAAAAIVNLNRIPSSSVIHILAPNTTSFRAKPASYSGARSVAVSKASGTGWAAHQPPQPPPPPPAHAPVANQLTLPKLQPHPSAYVVWLCSLLMLLEAWCYFFVIESCVNYTWEFEVEHVLDEFFP